MATSGRSFKDSVVDATGREVVALAFAAFAAIPAVGKILEAANAHQRGNEDQEQQGDRRGDDEPNVREEHEEHRHHPDGDYDSRDAEDDPSPVPDGTDTDAEADAALADGVLSDPAAHEPWSSVAWYWEEITWEIPDTTVPWTGDSYDQQFADSGNDPVWFDSGGPAYGVLSEDVRTQEPDDGSFSALDDMGWA